MDRDEALKLLPGGESVDKIHLRKRGLFAYVTLK